MMNTGLGSDIVLPGFVEGIVNIPLTTHYITCPDAEVDDAQHPQASSPPSCSAYLEADDASSDGPFSMPASSSAALVGNRDLP
jgi:hypothetical protein